MEMGHRDVVGTMSEYYFFYLHCVGLIRKCCFPSDMVHSKTLRAYLFTKKLRSHGMAHEDVMDTVTLESRLKTSGSC